LNRFSENSKLPFRVQPHHTGTAADSARVHATAFTNDMNIMNSVAREAASQTRSNSRHRGSLSSANTVNTSDTDSSSPSRRWSFDAAYNEFEEPDKKTHAYEIAEPLMHWQKLVNPKLKPREPYHCQSVILACTAGIGGVRNNHTWLKSAQLETIYSHKDVVSYSGLSIISSHSSAGLQQKFALERCGKGIGRALGVVCRWTLMKFFEELRDWAIEKGELTDRAAKWLADFPVEVEKFLNVFYDIVDQVEHLLRSEKTKGKGDFEVQYRPWNQRKPTHPMYTREEQLCVISFVRSWYIQQIILKRRCFFSTLKKEGGLGVLQKMLLIQDLRDQSSMDGYAMGFKDLNDRLMVGDSLTLRPEFETAQLLNVSETMVSGENLDTTYIAKLEELSNRWPRFIIVLKYWVTVKTLTDDDRQKKELERIIHPLQKKNS